MNPIPNPETNRRDFFQSLCGWGATVFALVASGAAAARFMIPNVLYEADRRYKALKPDDYVEGATFVPDARLFILRKGNSFRAISAVCTHLGCTVLRNNEGNGFHCPCHGSQFNENAVVTGGPAPKPLPWYLVTLTRDGRLMIDASQEVEHDKYLVV